MLKCLPSNVAHCSSLKSFFCLEQGSELQDRNFIRRPTQYIPPFLGLKQKARRPSMDDSDLIKACNEKTPLKEFDPCYIGS